MAFRQLERRITALEQRQAQGHAHPGAPLLLAGLKANGVTVFAPTRLLTIDLTPEDHWRLTYPYPRETTWAHFDWLIGRLAACLTPPDPVRWESYCLTVEAPWSMAAWITTIGMTERGAYDPILKTEVPEFHFELEPAQPLAPGPRRRYGPT